MGNRVGIGFDAHPLVEGRPLVLGGVQVPHGRGLSGHSDGDVLCHAIMDALLGASNLGDKGTHFPSSDPGLEGVSSLLLLSQVLALMKQNGWQIANIDATILAQQPKLAPYIPAMKSNIEATLELSQEGVVSIKATTTDYLGFAGREEGIAAQAVALLEEAA